MRIHGVAPRANSYGIRPVVSAEESIKGASWQRTGCLGTARVQMADSPQKALRGVSELAPALDAELAACEQQCGALRARLREFQATAARLLTLGQTLPLAFAEYAITVDGRRRPATVHDVDRLRRTWRGDFLLDIPGRLLCVRKGKRMVEHHLGGARVHRGIERVLVQGMSNPGQEFGHLCIPSRLGGDRAIGATVLSRYVLTIRRKIGDSGRKPAYVLNADVDRSFSDTCRGYVFSDRWKYAVVERVAVGNSVIHSDE